MTDEPYRLPALDGPAELCLHDLPIDAVPALMTRNGYPHHLAHEETSAGRIADNKALAYRAAELLTEYARDRVPAECEALTVVRDLINDLHHLADSLGIPWAEAARDYHYQDQIREEG